MTTDRRQQILRLYHQALAREPSECKVFLTAACAGDDDLRREVESLLAHEPPDEFLEAPERDSEGVRPFRELSGTLVGRQLGTYRIDSRLGSGGMGEVYRATDTTLGRSVAIKVLPPALAFDPDRRARLEREAKALASLNHPHIAHVYGLQAIPDAGSTGVVNALVMELVEGVTLTRTLQDGHLSIDDALRYGAEIADALAVAHAQGIVHRDVKPSNVMIGESGVKVLDFGLAKLADVTSDVADTALPHMHGITGQHEVLGTVAYMSPEQAEGKPVDARSDVFSLGIVLYQMLCGQRPFSGDTAIASLAATLKSAPPRPGVVRRNVPAALDHVVMRCLEKRREARYPSARAVHQLLSAQIASRSAREISRRAVLVGLAAMLLIGSVGLGVRSYVQASRVRWVEEEAVPQVTRLIAENRRLEAGALFRTAEKYAPASRSLPRLADGADTMRISFTSTPAGARLYISDYVAAASTDLSQWQSLGEAPLSIDWIPRRGHYRLRAIKEGFAPSERTLYGSPAWANVEVALQPLDDVPPGMVWVPSMNAEVPIIQVTPSIKLPGFWIDTYEVTNQQFKAFVDAGGYQKEEYWKEPFFKEGRTLSWREALAEFRDATNRPGPAGWQLGTYPEGTQNLPVAGVSWYEAAAYATFAGKSLPTAHEWWAAAQNNIADSDIVRLSNFGSQGLAPVGANAGIAMFGAYDMAGNLKEWVMNPSSDDRRYLLGGAWPEDSAVFTVANPQRPLAREKTFGFRCVRRVSPPPMSAFMPIAIAASVVRRPPVDDAAFGRLLELHAYDKTDLAANVDRVDDSSPYWRRETASFQAGYGNERTFAHVFLPKSSAPPYQTVIFIGGSGIHAARRVEDIGLEYQFILRAGRAVVIPVLDGTIERGPSEFRLPVNQDRIRDLRWSTDTGRTVDYLETRPDIDIQKLGYFGNSAGSMYGVRLTALDRRFKTAVFSAGGLFLREKPPETDPLNFAPRLRIPVLMLNGRDDFMLPYEISQRPLFEALGSKEKVLKRYEGGHLSVFGRPDLMREILDWFDKYLGPVSASPMTSP